MFKQVEWNEPTHTEQQKEIDPLSLAYQIVTHVLLKNRDITPGYCQTPGYDTSQTQIERFRATLFRDTQEAIWQTN